MATALPSCSFALGAGVLPSLVLGARLATGLGGTLLARGVTTRELPE